MCRITMLKTLSIQLCIILLLSNGIESTIYAKNISDVIFQNYDHSYQPLCDGVTQVNTTIGIAMRQIISLDEPNQIAKFKLWIRLKWYDCLLRWNASEHGDTNNIITPIQNIWYPDLTLYASVSSEFVGIKDYRATIMSDGTVYYNFPTVVEVLCPINVRNFPYDTQMCTLKFGSWAYHGFQLDVTPRQKSGDLSNMKAHVEWRVPRVPATKNVVYYNCCAEPYPDVTFEVYLERKAAYYIINIILPSIMITVLASLGYFLPVRSGEKISLIITVMLSMSVFQLLVADKLPASADSTPLILLFFNFIFGLSAVSTILQVLVINVYYRGEAHVQDWMKRFIIKPVCFLTFVNIPQKTDICCSKNKVEDLDKGSSTAANDIIWRRFSCALDRLGIFMFSVTLTVGCGVVFTQIKGED